MAASACLRVCDLILMAKAASSFAVLLGRFLKTIIVILLLPIPIGVLYEIIEQLSAIQIRGIAASELMRWGFLGYVGFHIILYRPAALFRAMHWIFSTLAAWLFGGQVSTTEEALAAAGDGKRKGKRSFKEPSAASGKSQGSPLVAFSPYVVPMSVVLVSVLGWLGLAFAENYRTSIEPLLFIALGSSVAFHWMMTADELQPQREQWHLETYLLAVILVFLLTLLIGGACLWWVLPDYSHYHALADGWERAAGIYRAAIRSLFF